MESMSSLSRGPSAKTARDLRNLKNSSKGSPTKYRWIRRDEWDEMNQI